MVRNTTDRRTEIVQEFLNGQTERAYAYGRLAVRENNGRHQLVAYGHEILADLDPETDHINLYTGHHGTVSQTVTNYVKILGRELSNSEGFDVTVHNNAAPNTGIGTRASESAQYINNYVGRFGRNLSPVEKDAKDTVREALIDRMNDFFN